MRPAGLDAANPRRTHGRRWYVAALALVLVATATVQVLIGRREYIGYDSYWHVFIARQDRWPNFWLEVRENAHPPLFYLLLRAASAWFGPTLLAYRAVSIAATVASTALVAVIVRRVTASRALAVVAAAAFGGSYGAIMIGLEVRAYALCAAFTLLAFVFYLDWLKTPAHRLSARTFTGFALAASTAVLTHYSTFFFLGALLGTLAVLAVMSGVWRRRLLAKAQARPLATACMFVTPLVVAAAAYIIHVKLWGGRLSHVSAFLFDPAADSPWRYLVRNTLNVAAIVLPGGDEAISGLESPSQRLALLVFGAVAIGGLIQLVRARAPRLGAATVVCAVLMVALNAVAGLTNKYPYGGAARHEFFLVPLLLVGFFTLVESGRRAAPRWLASRRVWTPLVACGVLASIAAWTTTFRLEPTAMFQRQMTNFRELIPAPKAVMLDRFTFINFFSHYHDAQWRLAAQWDQGAIAQVWNVDTATTRFVVCRETQWSLDMSSIVTYDSVVECAQRSGMDRVAIFRTHWWDAPASIAPLNRALAAENGLAVSAARADGNDGYVQFELDPAVLRECTGPPSAPPNLHVVSNSGRAVVLAWDAVGGPRTSYVVEAGLSAGSSDALTARVGRATSYTAPQVNPGTYYARVRAASTCGVSPPSSEIRVVVE